MKILKRLEAIENKFIKKETPELIFICYDCSKNQFCISECYNNYQKDFYLTHYKDYIFTGETHAIVLMDLINCPEKYENGLYSFDTDEIRKKCRLSKDEVFSICFVSTDKELMSNFKVIPHKSN
jgi:hypothetical protein